MATRSPEGLQALLGRVGVGHTAPRYAHADVQNSPVDLYRAYLAETIMKLTLCEPEVAYESIQWPGDQADLMVVLPRLRLPNENWNELAHQLTQQFPPSPLFGLPFADGIHLRLLFSPKTLARILLPYITDRGAAYGKNLSAGLRDDVGDSSPDRSHQRIVVEFSSPNLGKEFDGTHLRSTIIGAFIAALYQSMGFEVCRMNFIGDWGKHIGLLAVGWSRFGSDELFNADPLRHLLDVYSKIEGLSKSQQQNVTTNGVEGENTLENGVIDISAEKDDFFKRMEEGDADALELCKRFREVCIAKYTELYARLGINFDTCSGESLVSRETITEVEESLRRKGILEQSDDAWVIDFAKHESKKIGTGIFRYRNGTTSYLLRDVAGALERSRTYPFDKMIYVVSAKQDLHFQQLFRTLELMDYPDLAEKLQHVSFGKVRNVPIKDGSSGLLLQDILDQSRDAVQSCLQNSHDSILQDLEQSEDPARALDGLAAVVLMIQDLAIKRGSALTVDLKKMVAPDQHTGLYIQDCLSRLRAKLAGGGTIPNDEEGFDNIDYSVFGSCEEYADTLRLLAHFPSIVKSAFKSLESSTIMSYLFRLVDQMALVWDIEDEEDVEGEGSGSAAKAVVPLVFYDCVRLVLENGLNILGLPASLMAKSEHLNLPEDAQTASAEDKCEPEEKAEDVANRDETDDSEQLKEPQDVTKPEAEAEAGPETENA